MTLTPCPDYIGGAWLDRQGGTPAYNPSTGDVIAECPAGGTIGAALRRDLSR